MRTILDVFRGWSLSAFDPALHPRGQEDNPGQFAVRAGFHAVVRGEDGSYRHAGGEALAPEHAERLKALRLPPAWTGVQLSADPTAPLQAVGFDKKGRSQYLYSAAHTGAAAAAKFARVKAMVAVLPELDRRLRRDVTSADVPTREAAACLLLIRKTGLRPGSERDTGGDREALGATTLTTANVRAENGTVHLDFVGKKGVHIQQTVEDAELAALLAPRVAAGGRMYRTDETRLRAYLHKAVGAAFKPKDLRTVKAAETALAVMATMEAPTTAAAFKKARAAVGAAVAAKLGNTPAVALASYIPPEVFGPWQATLLSDRRSSSPASKNSAGRPTTSSPTAPGTVRPKRRKAGGTPPPPATTPTTDPPPTQLSRGSDEGTRLLDLLRQGPVLLSRGGSCSRHVAEILVHHFGREALDAHAVELSWKEQPRHAKGAAEGGRWTRGGAEHQAARAAQHRGHVAQAHALVATARGHAAGSFDTLVNRKGAVSDAVNAGAAEYAKAKSKKERERVREETFQGVRAAVFAEAGLEPGGEGKRSGRGGKVAAARPAAPEKAADAGGKAAAAARLKAPRPGREHQHHPVARAAGRRPASLSRAAAGSRLLELFRAGPVLLSRGDGRHHHCAEILVHLFGDDALHALGGVELSWREQPRHGKGKSEGGRWRKGSAEEQAAAGRVKAARRLNHLDNAHRLVGRARAAAVGSAERHGHIRSLAEHLSGMTLADLRELKRHHGLRASGLKRDLAKKLAARLAWTSHAGTEKNPSTGLDSVDTGSHNPSGGAGTSPAPKEPEDGKMETTTHSPTKPPRLDLQTLHQHFQALAKQTDGSLPATDHKEVAARYYAGRKAVEAHLAAHPEDAQHAERMADAFLDAMSLIQNAAGAATARHLKTAHADQYGAEYHELRGMMDAWNNATPDEPAPKPVAAKPAAGGKTAKVYQASADQQKALAAMGAKFSMGTWTIPIEKQAEAEALGLKVHP